MRRKIILIVLVLINLSALAQEIQIRGIVRSLEDSVVVATVKLMNEKGVIESTTSTHPLTGLFIFNKVNKGEVRKIVFSSIGYLTDTLLIRDSQKDIDVGEVILLNKTLTIDEVIVTASTVQTFASKDKILIPNSIRDYSSSGYDAIRQLPQFTENLVSNKLLTLDRKAVKVLLNGIESSESDLLTIPAKNIVRVEYYTQPPARYANLGLGAVINVITTAPKEAGSDYSINTKNSFTTGYGTNIVNAKFYNEKNQLDISYFWDYRNLNDNRINQQFEYGVDGSRYKDTEDGSLGSYRGDYNVAQLKYLRTIKDSYTLLTKVSYRFNPGNEQYTQKSSLSIDDNPPVIGVSQKDLRSNYNSFGADIYFSKQLKNDQEIAVNVVGTYYDSYSQNHLSRKMAGGSYDYDYTNDINNKSWSIITELLYNKKFENNSLTAGTRYYSKKLEQEYNSINNADNRQGITYIYAGLSGSLKKIAYNVEIGFEHSENSISGEITARTNFNVLKPSISLSYPLTTKSSLRFSSMAHSNVP